MGQNLGPAQIGNAYEMPTIPLRLKTVKVGWAAAHYRPWGQIQGVLHEHDPEMGQESALRSQPTAGRPNLTSTDLLFTGLCWMAVTRPLKPGKIP